MEEKYIPKVGNLVGITRSKKNWVSHMDKFIGDICKIKEVHNKNNRYCVYFDEVLYPEMTRFSWAYEDGHFEPYIPKKIKIKINLLWKNQKLET